MHKFIVTATQETEADSAEQAALLMYQQLSKGPAPIYYSVTDEKQVTTDLVLDRVKANEFSGVDHTAAPGNW
ncbi:hypothetical protein AB4Z52_05990 [Rhizobium sp. 2YAF20]|uniref:hypothetical protein n=1 Tax=Rhizobium sp. 2YAF20 TaxID=3233027 RepID=UPI003F9DFBD1